MKKVLYAFALLIGASLSAQAAPGDSTWVQATNRRFDRGNGYGPYDTSVTFPGGTASYRKIYMIFTLGKYACPGYNPNNPGDGPGQSGWCGDWDYTIMNYLMTPTGDTVELGRFMTPYARETWVRTPQNWTRRYIFDVTDFAPWMKSNSAFRVFYSGYSTGFKGDVKFLFIEGTPERNVLKIDRLWDGTYNYGHGSTPINAALTPKSNSAPGGSVSSEAKLNVTGHGGDDRRCSEFCPNSFTMTLNGSTLATQPLFKDNCSENDLYPQSGTWILARANWCPGEMVKTYSYPMPNVAAGSAYQLGMTFPQYTSTSTQPGTFPASYLISGVVMHYGALNKTLDAGIEDIIAPTNAEYHSRENPTATRPIINVRNSGSTAITSIEFEYGLVGRVPNRYTWTGSLASLQNQDVTLAPMPQLLLAGGDQQFYVKIVTVNQQADGDALNNSLSSTFTPAPIWPATIDVQLQSNNETMYTNLNSQTSWKIVDAAGNTVREKSDCPPSSNCEQTIALADGAYTFIVRDSGYYGYHDVTANRAVDRHTGTGLAGFTTSTGAIRVYDNSTGMQIPILGAYGGNFGSGFKQSFYVGAPVSVKNLQAAPVKLTAMPNPASNSFTVIVDGTGKRDGLIRILDVTGREVSRQAYGHGMVRINSEALQSGIYLVSYEGNDGSTARQRVVITH